jgi:DNA-binding FrmR family transcriptional regulator
MRTDIKASCQKRLNRIEGQVRGLGKMVDEDRYCIDIVTQISAVRAALRRVEEEILKDHVAHCVEQAIRSGDKADQRRKIAELMEVVGRTGDEGGHECLTRIKDAARSRTMLWKETATAPDRCGKRDKYR